MRFSGPPKIEQKCPIFRVKKVRKNVHFLSFFAKNDAHPPTGFALKLRKKRVWLHPTWQPGKRVYKGGCHPGKNPPIYTVLNAAFLRHPHCRGSQCTECTPSGESSRPRLDHTGEGSPTPPAKKNFLNFFSKYFFYNLKKNILKIFIKKIFFRISIRKSSFLWIRFY